MIGTLMRIGWTSLKRDRGALFLTFVLPVIFFSIFAWIFGNMGGSGGGELRKLDVLAVDLDQSDVTAKLIAELSAQEALRVVTELDESAAESRSDGSDVAAVASDSQPLDRDAALRAVRTGRVDAAIVLPKGFSDIYGTFVQAPEVELIFDASNPMAQHTISGLLQASSFSAAPGHLMRTGLNMLEAASGPLTEAQRQAVDQFDDLLAPAPGSAGNTSETADAGGNGGGAGLISVKATSARAESDGPSSASIVSYYAAGIGVMFLLFSVTGAAGGLLEQEETGTLDRLLTSNVGMSTLLLSNWGFFSLMGFAQVTVMFLWGAFVFGLELFSSKHLLGFVAMTAVTAAAASAFALVLATLCKTRAQLSGLSTIVILIMSAIGGSMIPRFVMPAFMDTAAKFTFNGWALDGFLKVFWYDDPAQSAVQALLELWPQIAFLSAITVAFLFIARSLGRRWETA